MLLSNKIQNQRVISVCHNDLVIILYSPSADFSSFAEDSVLFKLVFLTTVDLLCSLQGEKVGVFTSTYCQVLVKICMLI